MEIPRIPEILCSIFENCSYSELCSLSQTCTQFNDVVGDPVFVKILCDIRSISKQPTIHMMKQITCQKKVDKMCIQYELGTLKPVSITTELMFDGMLGTIYLKMRDRDLIDEFWKIAKNMLFIHFPIPMITNILKFIGFTVSRHYSWDKFRKYILRFIRYAPVNAPVIYKNITADDIMNIKEYWDTLNCEYVRRYRGINIV